jgi:hypothetical protein
MLRRTSQFRIQIAYKVHEMDRLISSFWGPDRSEYVTGPTQPAHDQDGMLLNEDPLRQRSPFGCQVRTNSKHIAGSPYMEDAILYDTISV